MIKKKKNQNNVEMRNAVTCHKLKFKEYYELLDLLNDNDKKKSE